MVEKIYDKVESIAELNQIAADLRKLGMKEELEKLAKKFFVPQENVTGYLTGKRYFLLDGGITENVYDMAKAKVLDEMFLLKDQNFGNVIGNYLISCCQDALFEKQILLTHKTLQRCIGYLMERAYSLVSEDVKKNRQNTCLAVDSAQVFEWVREYYFLDDKEKAEKEAKEANQKFLKCLGSGKSGKVTNHVYSKSCKQSKKKNTTAESSKVKVPAAAKNEMDSPNTVKKIQERKTDRKRNDGQMSLFDAGLTA